MRVVRGARHQSRYSPPSGFRYEGLYRVDAFWVEQGRSSFTIWRFRLEQLPDDTEPSSDTASLLAGRTLEAVVSPRRHVMSIQRIVRSSAVVQEVKAIHDHRCQVCGVCLQTGAGAYSEAAHIRPIGRPHNGPDVKTNLLCLCPNDHVLFEPGGIFVTDAFLVVSVPQNETIGELRCHPSHPLDPSALAYHRSLFDRG